MSDEEFWFGFQKETNGKNYNTIFGKEAQWNIKFDKKKPPKAAKDYECVRLVNGKFTRVQCSSTSGAYVCENHNYADRCEPESEPAKVDAKYHVEPIGWKGWEGKKYTIKNKNLSNSFRKKKQ